MTISKKSKLVDINKIEIYLLHLNFAYIVVFFIHIKKIFHNRVKGYILLKCGFIYSFGITTFFIYITLTCFGPKAINMVNGMYVKYIFPVDNQSCVLFVYKTKQLISYKQDITTGADSDTFERGGVNLNLAFDVASKSILRSSKYQKNR